MPLAPRVLAQQSPATQDGRLSWVGCQPVAPHTPSRKVLILREHPTLQGPGISTILQPTFREFPFHELGWIKHVEGRGLAVESRPFLRVRATSKVCMRSA